MIKKYALSISALLIALTLVGPAAASASSGTNFQGCGGSISYCYKPN